MTININDLRFMRDGSLPQVLHPDDLHLLAPIDWRGSGKQSALLMLHGFSSTPAVFRQLFPKLNGYDAIISPILPGHAQNISSFSKIKAEDWFKAVEGYCESLLKEYEKVDVLGFSLGGLLAYSLGQRYPLNHLYLLAPAFDLHIPLTLAIYLLKSLDFFGFSAVYNNGANMIVEHQQDIAYRTIPIKTILEVFELIKNFQYNPARCTSDLFLGKYDDVVDVQVVANLFHADPKVRIHWLEQSAHLLPLDSDSEIIASCINQKNTVALLDKTP